MCKYFNTETQTPRKFFDWRDKGLHITYWDVEAGEKVPDVPLLYSFEVNYVCFNLIGLQYWFTVCIGCFSNPCISRDILISHENLKNLLLLKPLYCGRKRLAARLSCDHKY